MEEFIFSITLVLIFLGILFFSKFRSHAWLLPAWFLPHKRLRVFFHRLRGVKIGKNVEIGYMVFIDNVYPSKVIIEDFSTVGTFSTILAHDNSSRNLQKNPKPVEGVIIRKNSFIGFNSIILPGCELGMNSMVTAGSVVNINVPEKTVAGGNPAIILYKMD